MKQALGAAIGAFWLVAKSRAVQWYAAGFASAMVLISLLFQQWRGALFYSVMVALAIYGNIHSSKNV